MGVYKDNSTTKGNRKPWVADVTVKHPDGRELRRKKRARTKAEAEEFDRALRAQLTQELYRPETIERPKAPTVSEHAPKFLARYALERKPGTVRQRQIFMRLYIIPALGSKRLDQIGTKEKEQLKAYVRSKQIANVHTINGVLSTLGAMLKDALRMGLIEHATPSLILPCPPTEADCLTEEEYSALVAAAEEHSPKAAVLVRLMGESALRIGEVFGLYWEDLNLKDLLLVVRRTIWRGEEVKPKSGKYREVGLTSKTRDALLRLSNERAGRLLPSQDGGPLRNTVVQGLFDRLCKAAQIRRITPHTLRHTALTQLAKVAPPHVVQSIAGHSSLRMTSRYLHSHRADILKAARSLEGEPTPPSGPQKDEPRRTLHRAALRSRRGYMYSLFGANSNSASIPTT